MQSRCKDKGKFSVLEIKNLNQTCTCSFVFLICNAGPSHPIQKVMNPEKVGFGPL